MSLKEYEIIDDPGSPAGRQLGGMAHAEPRKASRLLTAVEDFVRDGVSAGMRMAPNAGGGTLEDYLLPPHYVLAYAPDAAVLIRIDHAQKEGRVCRIL